MCSLIKAILGLVLVVCLICCFTEVAQAFTGKLQVPPEGKTQIITLKDGSTLVGKITSIGDSDIKFNTDMGEVTLAIDKIKEIKEISTSSIKGGEYWFPNPNRSRLLFGPTARTLNAGEGYFYDLWVFFPGIAYAFTDNIMISGGVSIIPEVDNQMFYIMPKIGFPAGEKLDIAATLMAFRLWEENFYFGLGSFTYGTDDQSITAGLGIAFTDDKMADQPAATFGGEYRLSRRMSLVAETWFIPGEADEGLIGLGGIRFFGEKMAVDVGFALSYENNSGEFDDIGDPVDDETVWLPYIDFVWNF